MSIDKSKLVVKTGKQHVVRKKKREKVAIIKAICELYSLGMYTLNSCIEAGGLTNKRTFYNWIEKDEKLMELYKKASEERTVKLKTELKEYAMGGLMKLVQGQTVELTKTKTRDLGDGVEEILETEKREVYHPPNAYAVVAALTNVDNKNFKRNPDADPEDEGEVNIPITKFIKKGESSQG